MYEAAVAYYEATGKRTLLDVAIRNADMLCNTFGTNKKRIASGHQEIEIGLVKLDRKSTRLNSSHITISYAVFFLKKKKQKQKKKKKKYNKSSAIRTM